MEKIDTWKASTYKKFLGLRTRPVRDLFCAIPNSFQPAKVYDLGCGPGNSTILLKERWPHAHIVGLDLSPNMLKTARATYPEIQFIEGDIAQFAPTDKIDCLFANASLHCVDHHEYLIPKLLTFLNPGGILAIQMPNNFHAPTHQIILQLLQSHPKWQHLLKKLRYGELTESLYDLSWYYNLLNKAGASHLQLWETEYFQEMKDYQDVFEWVKGTVLSPVLSEMDTENQEQFANAYQIAIASHYPYQDNGKILMSFRRIFIVGEVGPSL